MWPPSFFLELEGLWEAGLADQVMLGSSGGARNSPQPGVVTSSSRGDRQDVINKTNLPKSATSLAYFMWFGEAGAPPAHPGLKKYNRPTTS